MSLRAWMGVGSAALIAGAFVPVPDYLSWRAVVILDWHADEAVFLRPAMTWIPAALGIVTLTLLALGPPAQTGRFTALASVAALALYTLLSLVPWHAEARLLCQIIIGAALVAAGNRTALRAPEGRMPSALSWIGGAQIVFSVILWPDSLFDRRLPYHLGHDLLTYDWAASAFAFALFGYGLLAFSILPRRRPARGRRRVLAVLDYVLPIALPCALYLHARIRGDWSLVLKFWLLASGHTITLAAAIAAWLEPRGA